MSESLSVPRELVKKLPGRPSGAFSSLTESAYKPLSVPGLISVKSGGGALPATLPEPPHRCNPAIQFLDRLLGQMVAYGLSKTAILPDLHCYFVRRY